MAGCDSGVLREPFGAMAYVCVFVWVRSDWLIDDLGDGITALLTEIFSAS